MELPERYEGEAIRALRVWLVNAATGERKAATWWPSLGALKCSHHLSGTLTGEARKEHESLRAWWDEHREAVVTPLETQCREGKVPGLKLESPELLAPGPHLYALTTPWMLEVWEASKEGPACARFVQFDDERLLADARRFTWAGDRLLTSSVQAAQWASSNASLIQEAERFISRGLIPEMLALEGKT